MIRRLILFGIAMVWFTFLYACGSDSAESKDSERKTTTLKLAHSGSESHQYHIAAEKFKELVEEKSKSLKIEIHPNATLGSEGEVIEQVISGSVDMTTVAADSALANTVPEMNLFGIPYVFKDEKHVYKVLDGEIGADLLKLTEDKNMKGLGFWEVGFRHITNDETEIKKPEDVKGLKIRVQPAPVWENHMKTLGANPTPVDFNELYSALDQGVINGQENPLATIDSMKFYEVQKHLALTAHTYTPAVVLMSLEKWDRLSEEEQSVIKQAVDETATYQREYLADKEEEIKSKLKENGVTITEPDRELFREVTIKVKDEVADDTQKELINRIDKEK